MSKIYSSITELVGRTPLVELTNFEKDNNLKAKILGKLEYFNPTGSVKDRAALSMLEGAEKDGRLKPGQTVVETTSGNTGIALAAFCAAKNHPLIIYMEPGCTPERIQIMKAYGTDVRGLNDIPGADAILKEFGFNPVKLMEAVGKEAKEKDYFYVGQLFNEDNPKAHYQTTGPELVEDTDGKIDIAVMLVGTAGTIAGVGTYLKDNIKGVKVVGVQPTPDSLSFVPDAKATIDGVVVFQTEEKPCSHPFIVKRNFQFDEIINVSGEAAYESARELATSDGIFLGASAAAALTAAKELALRPENEGKNIVAVFADNGMKYLSTNMYRFD